MLLQVMPRASPPTSEELPLIDHSHIQQLLVGRVLQAMPHARKQQLFHLQYRVVQQASVMIHAYASEVRQHMVVPLIWWGKRHQGGLHGVAYRYGPWPLCMGWHMGAHAVQIG